MKSYKQQTMDAIHKLIKKYLAANPRIYNYFMFTECPLCEIYRYNINKILNKKYSSMCQGCFMSNNGFEGPGCCRFTSYLNATSAYKIYNNNRTCENRTKMVEAFHKRAEFFQNILPVLEKYPAKQFTPTGWKYFDIDINL